MSKEIWWQMLKGFTHFYDGKERGAVHPPGFVQVL